MEPDELRPVLEVCRAVWAAAGIVSCPETAGPKASAMAAAQEELARIDPDAQRRRGYDLNFLGDEPHIAPFPTCAEELLATASINFQVTSESRWIAKERLGKRLERRGLLPDRLQAVRDRIAHLGGRGSHATFFGR